MHQVPARFGGETGNYRSEDEPLVTGRSAFTDDLDAEGQAYGAFVRAPVAHARLKGVDASGALAMPGVIGVFTGADVRADGLGDIPPVAIAEGRDGRPMYPASMPILVHERIRYVGEPVALVVADTFSQAVDAAEAVELDFEMLTAAARIEDALDSGAEAIWPERSDNVALDWGGDEDDVGEAFKRAAHIERVRILDERISAVPIEPRAAIGSWNGEDEKYTLVASTQGVAVISKLLAEGVFKVATSQVRVITRDVGGGFGMKAQTYSEYGAVLYAARKLGRPVKWRNSRLESFLSDSHGRDGILEGELAFDAEGMMLGLRVRNLVGIGAYTTQYASIFGTTNTKNCLSSVYRIPAIDFGVKLVFTNTAPLGPYRGAGRPEAIIVIERLIDAAAAKLGIDRVELRRRNMIPSSLMPYQTPNGPIYDSGEFEAVLDKAVALADWDGFAKRRARSESAGRLRGIGMSCFLEVAGGILNEEARLRFLPDDTVALHLGVQAMGQGHLSTLPRVVADRLGIPVDRVALVEGDSDQVPAGTPSVASRSLMMAGSAAALACDAAIERGHEAAAQLFQVSGDDIAYGDGRFTVKATDQSVSLFELARMAREAGLGDEGSAGLDNVATFTSPQMSFPNGCHVCEVEIDPDTGVVEVVGYAAVDDVGNVVHEVIVDGQVHGGVAQGLSQVLGERIIYSEDGQLTTASFMDYFMPRADMLPFLKTAHHSVPCTTNPIGVKGAGESGVAGSLPAGYNAVIDALASRGVAQFDLPATPDRVWAALRDGRKA